MNTEMLSLGRVGRTGGTRVAIVVGILLLACVIGVGGVWLYKNRTGVKFPKQVKLEDFQTPLDKNLMVPVNTVVETEVVKYIDQEVVKRLLDDVETIKYCAEGVEVTPGQFPDRPDLHRIVDECAKIMGIKKPRVFISNCAGLTAVTINANDPIIVVHSSIIRRYSDPSELRFIIGHEMGHIKCGHVRPMAIARVVAALLPEKVASILLLGYNKWSREAEMSADNAGLICCQKQDKSEKALLRLVLDLDEHTIGRIDVDTYLKQGITEDLSSFSEMMQYAWILLKDHPSIPARINQLRTYAESSRYKQLW